MKQCTCFALKAINCICAEREDENSFAHWFYGAPHRIKYLRDHPVFLAAQEAWDAAKKQEAEKQEHVAWPCLIVEADFDKNTVTLAMKCENYIVGAGQYWLSAHPQPKAEQEPKREPLTDEQIGEIAIKSQDGISPHDDTLRFARAIEAAHGIKGN